MAAKKYAPNVRLMWPDVEGQAPALRYKAMTREYRRLAQRQQQVIANLLKLLGQVDVAAMTDAQVALAGLGDDEVRTLDEQYAGWGEEFHLDEGQVVPLTFDDDDLLPIRDAALRIGSEFGLSAASGNWLAQARALGRIGGIKDTQAGWLVRAGDVRQLLRDYSGQGWRAGRAGAEPGPAYVGVPPPRPRKGTGGAPTGVPA